MPIQRQNNEISDEESLSYAMEAGLLVENIEQYQQEMKGEGAIVAESLVGFLAEDYELGLKDLEDVESPAYYFDPMTGQISQVDRREIHSEYE